MKPPLKAEQPGDRSVGRPVHRTVWRWCRVLVHGVLALAGLFLLLAPLETLQFSLTYCYISIRCGSEVWSLCLLQLPFLVISLLICYLGSRLFLDGMHRGISQATAGRFIPASNQKKWRLILTAAVPGIASGLVLHARQEINTHEHAVALAAGAFILTALWQLIPRNATPHN